MTNKTSIFAATGAAFTAAVAVAVAAPTTATHTPTIARVAVLADPGASRADIAAAAQAARTRATRVAVRRVGGGPEARAQAAELAAQGYDVIAAAGPEARAAVAEQQAAGLATR